MSWAAKDWVSCPLFTGAQACVLAFSTVDRDSFEAIETWKQKVGTGSHSWISMLHWPISVQEFGTDVGTCAGHEMHAVRYLWWGACDEVHVMRCMLWDTCNEVHMMECMWWGACSEVHAVKCVWWVVCCEVHVMRCMLWGICGGVHVMRWLSCVLHVTYTTMCSACDYCVFCMCLPCVLHMTAICSTCVQVTAMFSTCTYHVFYMWLSCILHAINVFYMWLSCVLPMIIICSATWIIMCSTCDCYMFYLWSSYVLLHGSSGVLHVIVMCCTGRAWSGRDCHGDCAEQDRSHWRCLGAAVSTSTSSVHSSCGAFVTVSLITMVITVMIKFILKEL